MLLQKTLKARIFDLTMSKEALLRQEYECWQSRSRGDQNVPLSHGAEKGGQMESISIIIAFYLLLNGVAFFSFYNDKRKARRNEWRTPENRLLLLSLLGPFGAYAAMKVFRHKTHKTKFILVPFSLIAHIVVIAYFTYLVWSSSLPMPG